MGLKCTFLDWLSILELPLAGTSETTEVFLLRDVDVASTNLSLQVGLESMHFNLCSDFQCDLWQVSELRNIENNIIVSQHFGQETICSLLKIHLLTAINISTTSLRTYTIY